MARYRNDQDDDRDLYSREQQARREAAWGNDDSTSGRRRILENQRRPDFGGRYGERAEYQHDEPRYSGQGDRFRDEGLGSSLYDRRGDVSGRGLRGYYGPDRSRLRVRDIMTRDLVVATRDTTLREVAIMMKEEDTGVIPVVDYESNGGNGKVNTEARNNERNYDARNFSRGKLVGLVTDRDVVVRAVAEGKDCNIARAEEVMSTDIHSARPNDRLVDVIRKMGDKQVRRIPVTNENGHLRGIVSMADVAVETEADRELADAIEEISQGSSFWSKIFG